MALSTPQIYTKQVLFLPEQKIKLHIVRTPVLHRSASCLVVAFSGYHFVFVVYSQCYCHCCYHTITLLLRELGIEERIIANLCKALLQFLLREKIKSRAHSGLVTNSVLLFATSIILRVLEPSQATQSSILFCVLGAN